MTATPQGERTASAPAALVVFTLDGRQFALHLATVDRVVCIVDITPLPDAPEGVLGVVNIQGEILPVLDPRVRFRLPPRELRLSDQLIVAHTDRRKVALIVDTVVGVQKEVPALTVKAESILPGLEYLEGILKTRDDLILIHDLDKFLTTADERTLDSAMKIC